MTNDEIQLLADICTAEKQLEAGKGVNHSDAKAELRRGFGGITDEELISLADDAFLTYDEQEPSE